MVMRDPVPCVEHQLSTSSSKVFSRRLALPLAMRTIQTQDSRHVSLIRLLGGPCAHPIHDPQTRGKAFVPFTLPPLLDEPPVLQLLVTSFSVERHALDGSGFSPYTLHYTLFRSNSLCQRCWRQDQLRLGNGLQPTPSSSNFKTALLGISHLRTNVNRTCMSLLFNAYSVVLTGERHFQPGVLRSTYLPLVVGTILGVVGEDHSFLPVQTFV
ncbi:hypothetical protein P692DRAFT_20880974 [Suillus brevipes Sb2]|nr:hypothetical protein P692DRAFT_20880974 [Suillus brevipes Sb2]